MGWEHYWIGQWSTDATYCAGHPSSDSNLDPEPVSFVASGARSSCPTCWARHSSGTGIILFSYHESFHTDPPPSYAPTAGSCAASMGRFRHSTVGSSSARSLSWSSTSINYLGVVPSVVPSPVFRVPVVPSPPPSVTPVFPSPWFTHSYSRTIPSTPTCSTHSHACISR